MIEMTNQLFYGDPLMTARRVTDARRYITARWNAAHAERIDEDQVALFLADERYGNLTEGQKEFARNCRAEMDGVYRNTVFRTMQYQEMLRWGMVSDLMNFCEIFFPDSPAKCA